MYNEDKKMISSDKVGLDSTIPKKKVITELSTESSYNNTLLNIYPNSNGLSQYLEKIKPKDRKALRAVVNYLIDNKASGIYIMGSSLSKDKYNSIDVVVSAPYLARCAWIEEGIYNNRKLKRKFKFEPRASYIAAPEFPRQHSLGDILVNNIILHPKNKKAVPIYINIVTEERLEELIE